MFLFAGCATGRDLTSSHYLPAWENKLIQAPPPSETSAGHWAAHTAGKIGTGLKRTLLFPFAVVGNVALNAYTIPTWPIRYPLRGDKRLIVWHPLFHDGENTGWEYFSKEGNSDLV